MVKRAETSPKTIEVIPGKIQKTSLEVPEIEYKIVAQPVLKSKFVGNIIPLPTVLIFYLHPRELVVVSVIIQEIMENGACLLNKKQFCIRLKMTARTISSTFYNLRKMKIMYEMRNGRKIQRLINYDSVQYLNDLLEREDRGIYKRLRAKCKIKDVNNITQKDLDKAYDKYVLPADHDIEEEEEYD